MFSCSRAKILNSSHILCENWTFEFNCTDGVLGVNSRWHYLTFSPSSVSDTSRQQLISLSSLFSYNLIPTGGGGSTQQNILNIKRLGYNKRKLNYILEMVYYSSELQFFFSLIFIFCLYEFNEILKISWTSKVQFSTSWLVETEAGKPGNLQCSASTVQRKYWLRIPWHSPDSWPSCQFVQSPRHPPGWENTGPAPPRWAPPPYSGSTRLCRILQTQRGRDPR